VRVRRRITRALPLAAAGALIALGCGDGAATPSRTPAATSAGRPGAANVVAAGVMNFVDVSAESGLDLRNVNGDPVQKPTILESLGQGAAVLDYDLDGKLDVFVLNGDVLNGKPEGAAPRCGLFRQVAPFRFEDVSERAGVALRGWFQGAYAIDFDGDGDDDLFLTAWGRSRYLRNRGDGTFEDATEETGIGIDGWTSGAAFFDLDGDGDLDLYVARYATIDLKNPPHGGRPCTWKGLAVACGPHGLPAEADVVLRNDGGRFRVATEKTGVDAVAPSYGLGVVAFDFDSDGDQDVYVANDSMANFLLENRGGVLVDVAARAGCALGEGGRAQAGMGVDAADVDGDRRPDVVVTNFDEDVNTLYRNETTERLKSYFDATAASGLGPPSFRKLAWGARFFDADGDGRLDLAIANGHIYPQVDRAGVGGSFAQENQLFRNLGPDSRGLPRFELVRDAGSFFAKKACSRGLLTADFDDDLDSDLLVVEMDAPPSIGRNDGARRDGRFGVRLVGAGGNRPALGAVLSWTDDAGSERRLERTYGGGFYSTSDPRLIATFGAAGFGSASVRFASGRVVPLPAAIVGRYATVDEATGSVVVDGDAPPK
jgi:enediyne biosynthesis protein E4